jgi:hypothetical protein
MKIFELENPVLKKIITVIDKAKTNGGIPPASNILFIDFEPDEGFVYSADYDGAIAVYASRLDFDSGSTTGNWETDSMLNVDCYGFGDPVPNNEDPETLDPTVKEAQLRAQVLTTLAYKAIMDRQEIAGNPDQTVDRDFGTDINTGGKMPISIQKFSPSGTMATRRGAVIYRSIYKFPDIQEDVPSEPLGLPFAGSNDIDSETYNPGDEPEGD